MTNLFEFVLLGTEGCHLCDLAVPIVVEVAQHHQVTIMSEDIAECDNAVAMVNRYGDKIPVLLHEYSNKSLDWPFDHQQVDIFIREVLADGC